MKLQKAFTLVELLIAASIFLVLAVTVYSAFRTGVWGFRDITENIDIHQAARQTLERIDKDLRNAFVYSRGNKSRFLGEDSGMSFLTLLDTFTPGGMVKDYALVSYELKGNTLLRLCRKNQESLNTGSEVRPEEMVFNVVKLKFSYGSFDFTDKTLKFQDSWGSKDAVDEQKILPSAVRVTLSIKGRLAQEFERTIYLPTIK